MAHFLIATSLTNRSAPNYFRALARQLVANGHRVTFVVDQPRAAAEFGNPSLIVWPSPRPTRLRDTVFLFRWLRKHRPDCIVATFGATNVCMVVGRAVGVRSRVAWYRTLSSQIDLDSTVPRWKRAILRFRKRFVYRLATSVIANSQATACDVQKVFGVPREKCTVLHILMQEPCFAPPPKDPLLVVCVGRLSLSKGQATLIRAIPMVKKEFPGVVAEFVGDGPERERYVELARSIGVSENCRFVGAYPQTRALDRMAAATVCVVPSMSEAFGLVNVEAQAVGTPVIASAVDGIKEVVVDGETGYLVPPGDAQALADRIIHLLSDEVHNRQLGVQAKKHFDATFSLANIAQHASFFERLVAAAPRSANPSSAVA